jgi:hypothetical protein
MAKKAEPDLRDATPGLPITARAKLDAAATTAGGRRSTVAKVSHTLSVALAERLEEFAFFQRVSESAVIEFSLEAFFAQSDDDLKLGDQLRRGGAGRRRKS